MTIGIRIDPDAFEPGQPLEAFKTRANPAYANPLQYPEVPLPLGTTGTTGAPGPGFIASCSPMTHRTNIREDGTFPDALAASPPGATGEAGTEEQQQDVLVHVSPTSGSTIIRGNNWNPSRAEFDPAYGLDVGITQVMIDPSVFETAVNEPIGAQFLACLQDLVVRGIIEVLDDGTPMTPEQIRDFQA
jgi:hypothetical protein